MRLSALTGLGLRDVSSAQCELSCAFKTLLLLRNSLILIEKMGQNVVRPLLGGWENYPDIDEVPSFDPMLGFPNGRKVREPGASLDEMRCANVPPDLRDYCAHKLIDYFVCQRKHFPMDYKRCHHEKHEYHSCIRDDYLIRMMEVERERRLRLRKKKKEAAQAEMITA